MTPPDPRLAQLIAAHRRVRRPDPDLRARVETAVAEDARRERARRWIQGSVAAVAIAAAVLLVLRWSVGSSGIERGDDSPRDAAVYGRSEEKPTPAVPRARDRPGTPRTPATSEAPAPAPAPRLQPPTQAAPRSTPKPTPPPADDGTEEIRRLREAEVALGRDAAEALRLLNRHLDDFPDSGLSQEREALFILALCKTGAAADPRRTAFLGAHPRSPYAARIRAACER
jgi:hypothetical protein